MKKITHHHISFLNKLKSLGFRSAIIAGGAVRDTYFGRDINDIDIYINHADMYDKDSDDIGKLLHQKIASNPYSFSHLFENNLDVQYGSEYITTIWEYDEDGVIYQIMLLDFITPTGFMQKHFDLGICMAYCDGHQHHFTSEFLQDANNKTITVRGDFDERQLAHIIDHHLPKVEAKYPQHRTVVSPHLQQYLSAANRGALYAGSN